MFIGWSRYKLSGLTRYIIVIIGFWNHEHEDWYKVITTAQVHVKLCYCEF
jgi:hypothetical protein